MIRPLRRRFSSPSLRFLVVDGYDKAGREGLVAGGASTAGVLYDKMLQHVTPAPFRASCDIVFPADGAVLPDPKGYDGVAWTGCSLSLTTPDDPRVAPQIQFAHTVFQHGIPQFGSCWAAQIAAVAAGGTVRENPRGREMGFARKIKLTPAGRSHPMFINKPDVFNAYASHNDEVTHLPLGSEVLAGNAWSSIQAVAVKHDKGEFWGVQYHPEYSIYELARLTYCRIEKLMGMGFFRTEADALQYVDDLTALFHDETRNDIAWRLGIDQDVLSEDIKLCEVVNWVKRAVVPVRLQTDVYS